MKNEQQVRGSQSKKSLWPVFFPYPSSWLKSFALALWMNVVLMIAGFWGVIFGIALSSILNRPELLLCFLGLALLAAFLMFSYLHHFLWGNSPKKWPHWLPSPKSLKSGFFASIVVSLAIVVGIICVLPFHNFEIHSQTAIEYEAKWFGAIWLITAAYLYQVKYVMRRRFASKSKTALNR